MKNIIVYTIAFILGLTVISCESEDKVYSGTPFVQFADTTSYFPVTPSAEKTISVSLAASNAVPYDRTYGIEVLTNESNARLGQHFELVDNKVVIPANSTVGTFRLKGYHNNLPAEHEKMYATFAFISDKSEVLPVYGNKTKVYFFKYKDFVVDDFVGYYLCICTFPFSTSPTTFYVKADKGDSKSIIVRNWLMRNYDVTIKFDDSNPLAPAAVVDPQPAFADAFYGKVDVMSTPLAPSTFNTLTKAIDLRLIPFVPRVGSYGLYTYYLRSVPEEEAIGKIKSTMKAVQPPLSHSFTMNP